MSKMKQTKIKWLPEISEDFSVAFVKQYFNIIKDLSNEGEPERVLKLARAGIVEKDVTVNEGQMAASYEGYNKVEVGDLLLNPMDLYSGANCNVSELNGVISPAYSNLRAKDKKSICSKYYDYFFKTQYWTMAMFAHGKGVSFDNRWTLNNDTLKSYEIPVPSYETQKTIVAAIESKTTKIDALISNEEKQIEELKAYKQSLIIEIVTRGLDKTVEMKDSGIEWIGLIPNDWEIKKIGSLFIVRNEKVNDTDYKPLSVSKGGIVPQMENVAKSDANDNRKMVLKNDFVINSRSDRKQSCGVSSLDGSVSLINTVLYPIQNTQVFSPYLNYLMKNYGFAEEFYRWGHGIVADLWTTRWQEMKSIALPLPSIEKQKELCEFLDSKSLQINKLISLKKEKIEKLNSYKKSLIYEYVTGKKEA